MKLRSAGPFVVTLGAILAAIWGYLWITPRIQLSGYRVLPVEPGQVDLIAVEKEAGYRIIVSNGIAHLVETSGNSEEFDAPELDKQATNDAPRLPIRETLQALQGDIKALGKLVSAVNKLRNDDWPTQEVVWRSEDLEHALKSPGQLRSKLESDLNTRLDGSPLDQVSVDAVINGIVIDMPVKVAMPTPDGPKTVVCRVQEAYKTLFAGQVEGKVNEKFKITKEALAASYRDLANNLQKKGRKENVVASIESRISSQKLQELAKGPERILANIRVLVTEAMTTGASSVPYEGQNGTILSDVTLQVNEVGRMRLWKYSHENPGFQLLLTVNGVAIAAPRITTELSGSDVKLRGVPSRDQVEEAVSFINKAATGQTR
ncbi:MAG: hypothetical protein JSS66_09990 [Armatimonadetes bacterium]|nr:hypothetical protein [Armatimonadota bacterium]